MPASIVAVKELARSFENEIGKTGGTAKRRWVLMLSDNALQGEGPPNITTILAAVGISAAWGDYHPVHTVLRLRKVAVNERFEDNPYALEVIAEYGFVTDDELLTPADRAAKWSFESSPGSVPALFYYAGSIQRPLTNSAYDYYQGLTTEESLVQIKIEKNFTTYPSAWLALQNHVNDAVFLGCAIDTVKVVGVEASYTTEEFNKTLQSYYATTATLAYRQSSHRLLVPDIGFNFINQSPLEKRRAMVFDFQNAEWVASPNPVGLDNSGGLTLGAPAIRSEDGVGLRVNPRGNFETFGTPP